MIPAIDLLGDRAVRLEQGDYGRATEYGEPVELARSFAAAGATRLHAVDLDGARAGRIRPDVIAAIVEAAAPVPVQASGGVRSVADAEALVQAGADRVVVALDVRDGVVHGRGWTESSLGVANAIERCVAARVPRLLCTAIERDGT